ncbi:PR-1-like protein [Tricholoma matsutake]|nr:PR-1-like protein [Tricholoma matsutake 945]
MANIAKQPPRTNTFLERQRVCGKHAHLITSDHSSSIYQYDYLYNTLVMNPSVSSDVYCRRSRQGYVPREPVGFVAISYPNACFLSYSLSLIVHTPLLFNMIVFILLSIIFTLFSNYVVYALPLSEPSQSQINNILLAHNNIRSAHNASALIWSHQFGAKAASWADECLLQPTGGTLSDTPYGELQVAATGNFSIQDAIHAFVQDESSYNPDHPILSHFTQVVWKATTHVGCAVSQCKGLLTPHSGGTNCTSDLDPLDATYYVCLYTPPGNVIGQEEANVQP